MAAAKKKVTIKGKKGQKPVTFNKGGLHRALGVPEDETIPAEMMAAAKRSKNPRIRKMANMATGMLAKGRKTAAKNRKKKKAS